MHDLYRDNLLVSAAWFGNDLITLLLATPLFVLSLVYVKRGSQPALLVWLGMLFYTLYNYAFYLFGAAFNTFFLIYVLFAFSTVALIFGTATLHVGGIEKYLRPDPMNKWVGGFMMLVVVLLGLFHISLSLGYVITGEVPEIIANIGHPTNVIAALDLSFVVPFGFLGALWLWKGQTWGYVVAVIWNIKGAVYLIALSLASIQAFRVGAADDLFQLALWGPLAVGCIASSLLLLRNIKRPESS